MKGKRFWSVILLAWMVFIGVDFLFNASILESLWSEDINSLKPSRELFILIPFGYLSFLLLTILVGYVFNHIHHEKPSNERIWQFGIIFGVLFSAGNFFALFSIIDLPLRFLIVINLFYLGEILLIVRLFAVGFFTERFKRFAWLSVLSFFALIVLGVILQNIL